MVTLALAAPPVKFQAARPPSHDVRMENLVPIPMRDGVNLYADVYRPVKEGKYPVLVSRTPYSTERYPTRKPGRLEDNVKQPVAFVMESLDGMRAVAYMLEGHVKAWSFAAKLKSNSEPVSTYFEQGDQPGSRPFPHFDALVHCMEEMFITGKPLYPVERTLLTTCTLSMLFESRAWKKRIETDQLRISYRALPNTYFQRA